MLGRNNPSEEEEKYEEHGRFVLRDDPEEFVQDLLDGSPESVEWKTDIVSAEEIGCKEDHSLNAAQEERRRAVVRTRLRIGCCEPPIIVDDRVLSGQITLSVLEDEFEQSDDILCVKGLTSD